jgi:hypothetical protein
MSRKFRITGDTARLSHGFSIGEIVEIFGKEEIDVEFDDLFCNEEGMVYYVALADVEEIF